MLSIDNKKIVIFLNILFGLIYLCTIFQFQQIATACYKLTFVIIAIFWVKLALKKIVLFDILSLSIVGVSFICLYSSTLIEPHSLSIDFLLKWFGFICTVLYFNCMIKCKNELAIEKILFYITQILIISTIFYYVKNPVQAYMYKGTVLDKLCLNFSNPNVTALFLTPIFLFEFCYFINEKQKIIKCIYLLLAIILFVFITYTGSRNCIYSCVFFIILFLLNFKKKDKAIKSRTIYLLIALSPLIFSIIYMLLQDNFDSITKILPFISSNKSLDTRIIVWQRAFNYFLTFPFTGRYAYMVLYDSVTQMHNTHLDVLASYGIIVFLLFISYLYNIVKEKFSLANNRIYLYAFIVVIFCGFCEATLFSGSLGLNIYVGNFLLFSHKEIKE